MPPKSVTQGLLNIVTSLTWPLFTGTLVSRLCPLASPLGHSIIESNSVNLTQHTIIITQSICKVLYCFGVFRSAMTFTSREMKMHSTPYFWKIILPEGVLGSAASPSRENIFKW
jgi:hypothetical protein